MQTKKLSLEDRNTIADRLNAIDIHLAEFCFPNLYFFREVHRYEIIELDDVTLVGGVSYDNKRYLMPLHSPSEDPKPCLEHISDFLKETDYDCIFPIPEEWLGCFPEEKFERTYNENDSDYLFLTEKMADYPGKKMHKKRNLKNQFLKAYEAESRELNEETLPDALKLLEIWQNASTHMLETNDYGPCKEALEDREGFGLSGRVFYADGQPAGFVLGEPLNPSTFTIHFAKADIQFKGIYAYMFSEISAQLKDQYEYINMEQDLGKDGLRQTKRSYRPDLMAHKYRIEVK
ncbi:MAG: phosphatidylglycerol lysyltransferase domain-containing protein [Spirochaetales bacterium]|nr:phosphatidylglycerol lysyltransferase domain-containing protein [Spirochaetales bacterium]